MAKADKRENIIMVTLFLIWSFIPIADPLIADCQRAAYFRKSGLDGDTHEPHGRDNTQNEPTADPHR